jgi:flagellar motor switch protein FliN
MSDEEQDGQEADGTDEDGGLGLEELDNDMAAAMAAEEDDEDADAEPEASAKSAADLEAVFDIPVNVSAVLGRAHLPVNQLLKLGKGAVVELDRKVGEAIDIYVNNRLVARGEVVVVEDHLGVTMTEIIKSDSR